MDKNDLIYSYEPIWGSWEIENLIGTGSTGNVYKVIRNEYNKKYESAVKFIVVPTFEQYKSVISYFNSGDINSVSEYFENIVQYILNEIELLYDLKEHGNIINYEDHLIKKIDNKNEWHILIRMEYANSLDYHILNNKLSEKDIAKIGIDICSALDFCHNKNILHRDIKEANIFVSKNKIYKLGDFSISKEVSDVTMAHTKIGTFTYMAPEVFNNKPYTKNADLYSLGIVLYKLLNHCRMPFLPEHPEKILPKDIEKSNMSRLSGEEITKPSSINDDFFLILKKACAFNQTQRYEKAIEMKKDLESIYNSCSQEPILFINSNKENNTNTFISFKDANKTHTYNNLFNQNTVNDSELLNVSSLNKQNLSDENSSESDLVEEDKVNTTTTTTNKNDKFKNILNYVFKFSIIILPIILIVLLIIITKNSNSGTATEITKTQTTKIKKTTSIPDESSSNDKDDNAKTNNYYNNNKKNTDNRTLVPYKTDAIIFETPLNENTFIPSTSTTVPEPTNTIEPTEQLPTITPIPT
ncbi:MAG: serine/threonine-protein kinase, partial [Clostridiales bacterium]